LEDLHSRHARLAGCYRHMDSDAMVHLGQLELGML
jgi:hypothetical protein